MGNLYAIRRRAAPGRVPSPGRPCVWAVGGGKGGVGKSLVASSLAVAFARRGLRTVVVDADLGAANLHTWLGTQSPSRTLSHFLSGEVDDLAEVMAPTSVPNLSLVGGSRALTDMANPKSAQKQKFLRHIRRLGVDHVLVDLSAGSSFNVLDFFVAAQRGILVVTPEPTSIENAYYFLKAAFFRSLRAVARRPGVRAAIRVVLEERSRRRLLTPRELIAQVSQLDRSAGVLLQERARAFAPELIVNQVHPSEHRDPGRDIAIVARNFLGIHVQPLGCLPRDAHVVDSLREQRPVLERFPGCSFVRDLEKVAVRLLRNGAAAEPETPAPVARSNASPAPEAPLDLSRPGACFRRRREQLGLDLAEVCRQTRIRGIERIEDERFAELPPEPYVRGFLLQYARALGIREGEALAASFLERYRQAVAQA